MNSMRFAAQSTRSSLRLVPKTSYAHALLIEVADVHPLKGIDPIREAVDLIASLGGQDATGGGRLIELNQAGQEVADHTEELAYTLSHSSPTYAY